MPIEEAKELFATDIKKFETAVNDFLTVNNIELSQNQFDALASFTHQHGEHWWTEKPERKLPEFIREEYKEYGEYDPDKVREVFALHDDKGRRAIEAEVFINSCE